MDYIVSPWMIYLVGTLESISLLFGLLALLCFIVATIFIFVIADSVRWDEKFNEHKWNILTVYFLSLFFMSISICIPSKETVIQMIIAKNLTYSNAGKIVETGKNLKDELKKDVIDIIMAVKEKK